MADARQRRRPRFNCAATGEFEAHDRDRDAGFRSEDRRVAWPTGRLRRLATRVRWNGPILRAGCAECSQGGSARSAAAAQRPAENLHRHGHSQRDRLHGDAEMTRSLKFALVIGLCVAAVLRIAAADGLDPALILKPLADSWLTYSGD